MHATVTNPFSTRCTRPGRIAPRDDAGHLVDVGAMLDRLEELGGSAAIVGPHGSGKSTLLLHLAAAIERRGGRTTWIRVRSGTDVRPLWRAIRRAVPRETLCIDSWECLPRPCRGILRLAAGVRGCRLLVTAHHPIGLPVLTARNPSRRLLRSIVDSLLVPAPCHAALIQPADIDAAFARHGGNLRESLYELYDRFEIAVRSVPGQVGTDSADHDDPAAGRRTIHELAARFSYAGAPDRNLG